MKNKSIILGLVSAVFACNLVFTSCSEPKEVEKVTFLEKRVFTAEDSIIDLYPRMKGEAHGGTYFSRTDSTNQYGIGTVYNVNDTTLNKDLRIKINFWARANKSNPDCLYILSLQEGDKIISWNEVKIIDKVTEANKWININDSITIPGNLINKPGLIVKAYTFNTKKDVSLDGDDLELVFSNVKKELVE
jgi:hypothetical protein